jgi:hypothetical protein
MDVDRSAGRIVHDAQKLRELLRRGHRPRRHRNLHIGQPRRFGHRLLVGVGVVARQVHDGLHAERFQIGEVVCVRLRAAIEGRVDAPEVVDVDRFNRRGVCRRKVDAAVARPVVPG